MSYQGPAGFVGPQGFQGCTGPNGLQGTPYGPPGTPTFYQNGIIPYISTGIVNVSILSGDNPSGSYYAFNGLLALDTTPFANKISETHGAFWTFQNTTGGTTSDVYFTGTLPVIYNGTTDGRRVTYPNKSKFTLVYSIDPNTSAKSFIIF